MVVLPPLPRTFYLRPTLRVAPDLIGKLLVRRLGTELLIGRIVEVEGYLGEKDPASHAYRGMTERNSAMFLNGGHLYVYFTYGMHFCCNVVTESHGVGRAILLRAVEPRAGIEAMARKRDGRTLGKLADGPAKLCQAFGLGRPENGIDLCDSIVWIATDPEEPLFTVQRSARVGIREGTEHRWRYFMKGSPFVSGGRPSSTE